MHGSTREFDVKKKFRLAQRAAPVVSAGGTVDYLETGGFTGRSMHAGGVGIPGARSGSRPTSHREWSEWTWSRQRKHGGSRNADAVGAAPAVAK
jgi:hypothetical protein